MILINKHLDTGLVEHIAVFDCAGVRYKDSCNDLTIARARGTSIAVVPGEPVNRVFQKICEERRHPERIVTIEASEFFVFEYQDCWDEDE